MILLEQVAETVIVEQRVGMNYNEQICRGGYIVYSLAPVYSEAYNSLLYGKYVYG